VSGRQAESAQIVAVIEKNGGSVIYVRYPDKGHGLVRPTNNQDFMGRCEPMEG
jgi:dipeptidyl aminopeptidase/acylaminoacyl peptidase